MTRTIFIAAITFATFVAAPAFAQRPQVLRSVEQARAFCKYSEPRSSLERAEESDGHRTTDPDEAYDAARRRLAQRPVKVLLSAEAAPVIEYDRVTGALEVSLYKNARFAGKYAVGSNIGTVGFELPETEGQKLWARYEAGTASLELTFLPLAWSDYDRALCRDVGELAVLDGDVLGAKLVDELGRPLASYKSRLGREVALMREHRIKGYLDSGTPVITVSSVAPYPRGRARLDGETKSRMKSRLRAALYGCYLKGLAENGRLQGALVVKIAADEATVLVDSLHDETTRGCALQRITQLRRSRNDATLKATVIFRLEEAPSL